MKRHICPPNFASIIETVTGVEAVEPKIVGNFSLFSRIFKEKIV